MLKRFWWACLSLGLMLAASACESVDNCKEGDKGCLAGSCLSGDKCLFGALQCVELTSDGSRVCGEAKSNGTFNCGSAGKCRPVDDGDGDGDGDAGDGDDASVDPNPPCECTGEFEVCAPGTSDQCLNYCEDPGPGYIPLGERKDETQFLPCHFKDAAKTKLVSYADACRATWKQICMRSELFCGGFKCADDFHNSEEAQALCQAKGADAAVIYTWCETVRDAECEAFAECTDPAFPLDCSKSADFVCEKSCEFANDGACDDGDPKTASFFECDWGTDCGDCGPRLGTPVGKQPLGELCVEDKQCEGFSADLTKNKAWCFEVTNVADTFRCMPDCSGDKTCPDGYACKGITLRGEPVMQGNVKARGCDAIICQ